MQGDHLPAFFLGRFLGRRRLLDATGDGVHSLPAAVGSEYLGRGERLVRPDRLKPHPPQYRSRVPAGYGSVHREYGVDQTGGQQQPQLGRWAAAVDDFQDTAQCRIGEGGRCS